MRDGTYTILALMIAILSHNTMAYAQTRVVPVISASERYDSNVFFGGQPSVSQNFHRDDYVTNVTPQVSVIHRGPLGDATLAGGFTAERYVNHPALGYVGANGSLSLDLTPLLSRLDPRLRVRVSDFFLYTPQPPGFIAGDTAQAENPFIRGVQSFRANSTYNTATGSVSYDLSPRSFLNASYTRSTASFGSAVGAGPGLLINTTTQAISGGPNLRLTPFDTISATYQYYRTDSNVKTLQPTYKNHVATASWSHTVTPSFSFRVGAGGSMIETVRDDTGRVIVPGGEVFPNASVSLNWNSMVRSFATETGTIPGFSNYLGGIGTMGLIGSTVPGGVTSFGGTPVAAGATTVSLSYSTGIYPAFIGNTGPMLSHVVGLTGSYGITGRLSLSAAGYETRNDGVRSALFFETRQATVGLNFLVTSTIRASTSYSYQWTQQGGFGTGLGILDKFERHAMMLTLSAAFDPRFFAPVIQSLGGASAAPEAEQKR